MGKGIDVARMENPEHAQILDELKDQLLIVLFKRLGGSVSIPVSEIDNTGLNLLAFRIDLESRMFHFEILEKS